MMIVQTDIRFYLRDGIIYYDTARGGHRMRKSTGIKADHLQDKTTSRQLTRYRTIFMYLSDSSEDLSNDSLHQRVQDEYWGKQSESIARSSIGDLSLVEIMREFIDKIERGEIVHRRTGLRYELNSILSYRSSLRMLERMVSRRKWKVSEMNEDFKQWIIRSMNRSGLRSTTKATRLSHISRAVRWKISQLEQDTTITLSLSEINLKDRVRGYLKQDLQVASEARSQVILNHADIRALLSYDGDLVEIRDVFLFMIYTGMRHSDYYQNRISTQGQYQFVQKKVKQKTKIPLSNEAIALLEQYHYHLPRIDGDTMNEGIKLIAKHSGINDEVLIKDTKTGTVEWHYEPKWKHIKNHTARRTFATLLSWYGESHTRVVALMGQRSLTNFERYIKLEQLDGEPTDRLITYG